MVKGVNKNIIEVNDTNNEFFERIVFYLAPKYETLDVKAKETAFREMEKLFIENVDTKSFDCKKIKFKSKTKRILLFGTGAFLLLGVATALLFILNIF